jgi:hypothetical protein
MIHRIQPFILALVVSLIGAIQSRNLTYATSTSTIVALSGQAAPDGNGILLSMSAFGGPPVLTDAGISVFTATLMSTTGGSSDNEGIFCGSGGQLGQIARKGQSLPGGDAISAFHTIASSDGGHTAFWADLTGTGAPQGVYRGSGAQVIKISRTNDLVPGGDGKFSSFGWPAVNDFGQVSFLSSLKDTIGGGANNLGIFRGNGVQLTQIARKGQTAPDGNGSFSSFGSRTWINGNDQIAFAGSLMLTIGGNNDNYGIFRGQGGAITQIVREGQSAPDGNGTFLNIYEPRGLDDAGRVVFTAEMAGTSMPGSDDTGIFRGGGGPLTTIVRSGQLAPDGSSVFRGFSIDPVINGLGQAAFGASLINDEVGIYRGDGNVLTRIVRTGDPSPDGNGNFSFFFEPAINNHGQIAFKAILNNTVGGASDNAGVFLYDDLLGLIQVARMREVISGRLVISLNLETRNDGDGLGESGRVSYQFRLADGYEGVAIWTPDYIGDYNEDGMVDAADYVFWRKQRYTPLAYDGWRTNFGAVVDNDRFESTSVIPEPMSANLAINCVVAILLSTRLRFGLFYERPGSSLGRIGRRTQCAEWD